MTARSARRLAIGLLVALSAGLAGCALAPIANRSPQAVIEASAVRGAPPLAVAFDGAKSRDDREVVAYRWALDGETVSTEARFEHTFRHGGQYAVELTVLDADGLAGRASTVVDVDNAPPVASFRLSDDAPWIAAPMTVDATLSSDPEGLPLSYHWGFGDGSSATGPTATHAYEEEGAYLVTLVVRDAAGAEASASHRVIVQRRVPGGGCGGSRPVPLR